MNSKGTQAFALISMALMFGLALVWIFSGALIPRQQSANTGGASFVAGGVRIVPLTVALVVAAVIAAMFVWSARKKR